MSYDVAVWWSDRPLPSREAAALYEAMCDDRDPGLTTRPEFATFLAELRTEIPFELSGDDSPWASEPTLARTHAIFCIVRSEARRVFETLRALAHRRGLVVFDPQRGVVDWPPSLEAMPHARLSDCDGRVVDEPSEAELRDFLGAIGGENWFALLERADQRYAQAAFGPNARVSRVGAWQLEVRDGAADRHFGKDATLDEVVAVFRAMQLDRDWRLGAGWEALAP